MSTNIETKSWCDDPQACRAACAALGAKLAWRQQQTDTYFRVPSGHLKLRENADGARSLIQYRRANSPLMRESNFHLAHLAPGHDGDTLITALTEALGIRTRVPKTRERYELPGALVNLDSVPDLGSFVEIEVQVEKFASAAAAQAEAARLSAALGLRSADAVSWSYGSLLRMDEVSRAWRAKLASSTARDHNDRVPRMVVLDGASCTGKSTLLHLLVKDESLGLSLVPRHSTREPRPHERESSEYRFVSRDEFENLASDGAFMEYRDFEFGMSYGMAWERIAEPLLAGRSAIAVMNLGNIRHVRRVYPEAITILVTAPEETIRRRLIERGMNKPEQIEERLGNARRVESLRPHYHLVIENGDGRLEEVKRSVTKYIRERVDSGQ